MKISAFLSACVTAAFLPIAAATAQMPVLPLSAGIHLIRAEVAYTFDTRMKGLMFRESLGPNEGMLFVFPDVQLHCMWMKNTPTPLSVAFIDENSVIVSISDMQPHSETSHCAAAPARFALEMNRGWFVQKGIKAGAKIRGLDKAPAPR